jgi:hypothetical protein
MAKKLIDQEEVARVLGITPEQVNSLRDRKKLFPYRDGDQWKYKEEDIERYREEMQEEKEAAGPEAAVEEEPWTGGDMENVELQLNDDLDSILLSEIELGKSSTEGASTIIGKAGEAASPDSDLPPAAEPKAPSPSSIGTGDSSISLASEPPKGDSTITLAGEPVGPGSSGFSLAGESAVTLGGDAPAAKSSSGFGLATESDIKIGGDSGLSLAASDVKLSPGGSQAGKKPGGSSDKLFGSDALKLSDDELSLIESPSAKAKAGEGSKKTSGSSIKLGDEELEVVLGPGSDVTQSPTDSGIQLISASDSGLSLDEPLQLGSSAKRLLDLDEGGATTEEVATEAAPEKGDDEFLLTGVEEATEESSDSGSQVIALDTDDELSSGMFAPAASGTGLLEEEPAAVAQPALAPAPTTFAAPGVIAAAAPAEAPFSGANITVLAVCVVLLMFCGMMTFDLMRNMWSWDGAYSANSSILETIGSTIGWMEK